MATRVISEDSEGCYDRYMNEFERCELNAQRRGVTLRPHWETHHFPPESDAHWEPLAVPAHQTHLEAQEEDNTVIAHPAFAEAAMDDA